jgi:hypothetical protein
VINNKLISLSIIFVLNILLFADLYSQQNQALSDYVSFLKNVQQSPKEYILKLFENSDIVILCERSHPEFTQYEMIIDLINDNRFIQKIGHVFTEVQTIMILNS